MSVFSLDESHPFKVAHKHSANHRKEIEDSFLCACFHCVSYFKPSKITEWVDNEMTAMCPKCGVDSVIGDASAFGIDETFIRAMNKAWF